MAEMIVPKTSFEVTKSTFEEFDSDPAGFLRRQIGSIEGENPLFVDDCLKSVAYMALKDTHHIAQQFLAGTFYRYSCTAREVSRVGGRIPFIGQGTIQRTILELTRLTAEDSGQDELVTKIQQDDPEIGNILKPLLLRNDHDAFIEGSHITHLHFSLLDPDNLEQPQAIPEPDHSSIVPIVRRSIVRAALLETILDPREFTVNIFDQAQQHFPDLVARSKMAASVVGNYKDIYELLASFTIYGVIQELSQKYETFPPVSEKDPAISKALEEKEDKTLAEYNLSVSDEIRKTNPHLNWGMDLLFKPISRTLGNTGVAVAMNAIVNSYTSLKAALS